MLNGHIHNLNSFIPLNEISQKENFFYIRIGSIRSGDLVLFEMNIWNKTQYEWQKVWVASFIFWSLNFLKPGYPIWPYLWFCPRLCVTTVYHRVIISDIKFNMSETLWPFFGVLFIVFSSHKFSSVIKVSRKSCTINFL